MNDMTLNGNSMYDEVAEISKLNQVEGFDPRRFMRLIQKEGQTGKYYLDVAYRKLWFRLCHPEGKIVKKLIKLTDQVVIVEARVYLNRNDAEDNFVSNALAQKYQTNDDQFGNKYVELAETAAVGRALSDAGFGLQFADMEEDFDPEVTEAPIDAQIMHGGTMIPENALYQETVSADMSGEGSAESSMADDNIPGQYGIESYIPMPEEVGAAMQQGITPAMAQTPAMQQSVPQTPAMNPNVSSKPIPMQNSTGQVMQGNFPNASSQTNRPENRSMQAQAGGIRKDMPLEQIYSMLNRDIAAGVVVPVGFNKGKTLGQVAMEKPDSLEWYVTSYGGPDNLLRAAAKFLLDMALAQAS